ncbi:hypothetical protein [Halarcobacter mediterraneus]|uniref:hypothetical protein n=1 Tax=Halarcobacter mediterraneus TaxID=2023153 RepID=UPI0013E99E3D|nr:hypothetical protein [Halarcobacter mediterraneus]
MKTFLLLFSTIFLFSACATWKGVKKDSSDAWKTTKTETKKAYKATKKAIHKMTEEEE